MASAAVASSAGDVAGKLASWDLICSGNLRKKSPSSNLEVSLVVASGHKDKMLSMRTDGFSAPRGGRSRRSLTFCISVFPYALHSYCFSSV